MKKYIIFMISVIFLISIVSAQTATFVNRASPDLRQYYSGEGRLGTYYPILGDRDSCEARQDLILQVAPVGCQPTVVRSDILAEQNVPVFCQLQAIQVNPLVDIKQIRNIRFSGNYPDEVAGTGFHPANSALRTSNVLLGNPLLNDIGYVVVVLKENENEDELPEFINFTMTARLDYYSGNAFGAGASEFLLKPVTDQEWESVRGKQSFLNGDYFLRLEDITSERALVSIYHQDRKIQTVSVDRTGPSGEIYLPGNYCRFGIKLSYSGFVSTESTARLRVGDDNIEVYEGSRFLNNKCVVREINVQSSNEGSTDIVCGSERFTLSISPQDLFTGDLVKFVEGRDGIWEIQTINNDKTFSLVSLEDGSVMNNVQSSQIFPIDDDKLYEAIYNPDVEEHAKSSIESYEEIALNYPLERDNSNYFGENALERAIEFAGSLNKESTQVRLINLLLEQYPDADNYSKYSDLLTRIYSLDSDRASVVIDIDNDYKSIKLIELNIPDEKSSASFVWGPERFSVEVGNSTSTSLGEITLIRINRNAANVRVTCSDGKSSNYNLDEEETIDNVCGRSLRISSFDIKDFARVRVEPVARTSGETNVSVNIGIEKRAIQLSPQKTKEKIDNLNETIEEWGAISENLGNVVTGLKAACFATSGILTAKTFLTGLSGEALARQKVMRDEGGWTDKCRELVSQGSYSSLDECFKAKGSDINRDVEAMTSAINSVNERVEKIQGDYVKDSGFFESTVVDTDGLKSSNLNYLKERFSNSEITVTTSSNEQIILGEIVTKINSSDEIPLDKMNDIELYANLIEDSRISPEQREAFEKRLGFILDDVKEVVDDREQVSDIQQRLNSMGITGSVDVVTSGRNTRTYDSRSVYPTSDSLSLGVEAGTPVHVIDFDGDQYLLALSNIDERYLGVEKAYKLDSTGESLSATEADSRTLNEIKSKFTFRKLPSGSYNFPFAEGEAIVKYYETELLYVGQWDKTQIYRAA